jgi:hypothetical protein
VLICHPIKCLKIAANAIFEAIALIGEQLNNCAGDSLIRMKYAEQQVQILPHPEAMSTH